MKLYKYESLEELNLALKEFEEENIPISKVKLLTESDYRGVGADITGKFVLKTVYYVLTDEKNQYQHKPEKAKELVEEPMPW